MTTKVTQETADDIEEGDRITVKYTKPHYLANGSDVPGQSMTGVVDNLDDLEHGYVGFEANGGYWWLAFKKNQLRTRSLKKDPNCRGIDATGTFVSA